MSKGFWNDLKKPVFALAPMDDVTDASFRQMVNKYSGDTCSVMFTEFVACDGLCSEGKEALMPRLLFDKCEKPLVAQFFGAKPENFYKCAHLAQELGFDGIDINMGCPDKNIEKQGAGASLMLNPPLAKKIIEETKRGAGDLPVSVKTRLGYKENNIKEWMKYLLETGPAVISVHGRTRQGLYVAPADWNAIAEAVHVAKDSKALIIGNGDIKNMTDAKEKVKKYGVDGVMVGRATFGNPWFFSGKNPEQVDLNERLGVLLEHARLFESTYGETRGFSMIRKHFKAYTLGFRGAKRLREQIMAAQNADKVEEAIKGFLEQKKGSTEVDP